jgi:hypothetical protein
MTDARDGRQIDRIIAHTVERARIPLIEPVKSENVEVRLRLTPLTAAAMGVGWGGDDNPAEPSCVPVATGPVQAPKPCFPSDSWDSARERTRQDGVTHPHYAGRRSHV